MSDSTLLPIIGRMAPAGAIEVTFRVNMSIQAEGQNFFPGFDRRSFFDFNGRALPVVRALGQLTEAVRLKVAPTGAALILSWPLSGAGMVLTSTLSLSNPGAWTPVNVAPQTEGLDFRATLPRTGPVRFYRLESD